MKSQCERVLCDKIDTEVQGRGRGVCGDGDRNIFLNVSVQTCVVPQVVVPLYYTAFQYNTPSLLANCCHFLLMDYDKVVDDGHTTLLHILDNNPLESIP